MNFIFSAAFMANSFSMTGLLILLSLAGDSAFAADVGIVQAATLALFYAFSGNARNLILNQNSGVTARSILSNRFILLVPLAIAAYWLSAIMTDVPPLLAIALILRRALEWFDEIYLSDMERLDIKKSAFQYTFLQAGLLIFCFLWLILKLPYPLFGLLIWALFPLALSIKFYRKNIPTWSKLFVPSISRKLLPHIGSSMIIGVTVYVFRLLIIMATGKSVAGDLFTAFAIGGVLGSVFANAIGPSLALHQKRSLNYHMPTIIKSFLVVFLSVGLLLVTLSLLKIGVLSFTGKSLLFWQATGFSMVAGTVMVFAQMIRHRLLQHHQEQDLFGPDVMMNILLIAAVPFGYSLFGLQLMSALYLLSAVFAYLFYASYEFGEGIKSGLSKANIRRLKVVLVAMLFIPLFFQMHGGLFHETRMVFDSKGGLSLLPIPLSVIGCFLGVIFLGNYQQARLSFTFIFITFILMTFATILTTGQQSGLEESKFIFLMQFTIPMFGMVLGQFFNQKEDNNLSLDLEKTLFFVLAIFVPLQIVCSWIQGFNYLSPNLYLMSIYQHMQYVPVVFVSAYLLVFVGLWTLPNYRIYLAYLMLVMSVYVIASMSILAILMLHAGMLSFFWYQHKRDKNKQLLVIVILGLIISTLYSLSFVESNMAGKVFLQKENIQQTRIADIPSKLPVNLVQSLASWEYYSQGVLEDTGSLLFGHAERPDSELYSSAHNYYLDFAYNFGVLAIVPLIWLIFYTFKQIVNCVKDTKSINKTVDLVVITLSGIVFFLLLMDNFLNVSLRQPYSGIFTFFLWGLLINKLSQISIKGSNVIQT